MGPYQSNDYDMGSFTDFRSVRACNTYAAGHVKNTKDVHECNSISMNRMINDLNEVFWIFLD